MNTLVPVLLALPFRNLAFAKTQRLLADSLQRGSRSIFVLPRREFLADVAAWLGIGLLLALIYWFHFRAPVTTGMKVVMGCACFGVFGGMLRYLATEKQIIRAQRNAGRRDLPAPEGMLSVSAKMLFFTVTILVFLALIVLLMIFMDIHFLLMHRDSMGPDIFMGIFKEIAFAFLVLLGMSLTVVAHFSRNMKMVLAHQLSVMERVAGGDYGEQVPVVSNDEFGIIAAKTNEMIKGLQERDACRRSFATYMTPEVSEKILKGEISREGEMCRVSILFCDLRGYTPLVEQTAPTEVVAFLNAYFTEMERSIRENNGLVLQYIGDEIEAVFGYPLPEPDHARKAVAAALDMRRGLERLNEARVARGSEPVRHGIGIHSGEVLAGSVGSADRLVYAMVGETVNVASRIQNLNKTFGTDILIGDETRSLLPPGAFRLEGLGRTPIRGKREAVEIHQVVSSA